MKKYYPILTGIIVFLFFTFLFASDDTPPNFITNCEDQMGGPGICKPIPEGGFFCDFVEEGILGDCKATTMTIIEEEEVGGGG